MTRNLSRNVYVCPKSYFQVLTLFLSLFRFFFILVHFWLETWLEMFIFTQNRSFNFFLFFYHSFVIYHFYKIRGLQSILNVFSLLNADFSESEKCCKWSKTIFFFMLRSRYFKMVKCWNFAKFPKTTVFLIKKCNTFIFRNCKLIENCEHNKMPKFDEMSKNHFIFMPRSLLFISRNHKWLKMIKMIKTNTIIWKKWLKSTQISWFEVIYNSKNPENWDSAPEPNSKSLAENEQNRPMSFLVTRC